MYDGYYNTNSNTRHTCPQPEEPAVWIGILKHREILSWPDFFSGHISLYDDWDADTGLGLFVPVVALTLVGGNAGSIETGGITDWASAERQEEMWKWGIEFPNVSYLVKASVWNPSLHLHISGAAQNPFKHSDVQTGSHLSANVEFWGVLYPSQHFFCSSISLYS